MEVESIDEGTVGKIIVAAGTEGVKVGAVIMQLLEDGETAADLGAPVAAPAPALEAKTAPEPAPAPAPAAAASSAPAAAVVPNDPDISSSRSSRLFPAPSSA